MDLDNFINMKLNQLSTLYATSEDVLFNGFYEDVSPESLKEIFTLLHSKLNRLLEHMNHKNTRGVGGHYNAKESRELLDIIKKTRVLQATLQEGESDKCFELILEYEEVLESCSSFLSTDGGSAIPKDFPHIILIEHKPIFLMKETRLIKKISKENIKLKLIGEGSYAKVFKYKDPYYSNHFIIKKSKDELNIKEIERFKNEYQDLKRLDSPFIIKAYNYNKENNEYTMECADETLDAFINRNNNKLTFEKQRVLIVQLLEAFNYIRNEGLLHRDISYSNILLKHFKDGTSLIKVCDFGMVKRPESKLTSLGTDVKGSINDYTDLNRVGFENYSIEHETFALSKLVYFILTGRKGRYNSEKNVELKCFILKATSPDKKDRFSSIEELRNFILKEVFPSVKKARNNM